jgi:hypothetical protein
MDVFEQLAIVRARDRLLRVVTTGAEATATPYDQAIALTDAAGVLGQVGMPHMLVGGIAVAVHTGHARATIDVNFAVRSDADRAAVVAAFVAAGFQHKGTHPHSIHFVHGSGEPVQLALDGGFDALIARATTCDVRGLVVPIATREDLIAMKLRAAADPGRRRSKALQDRVDVELLRGDVPDVHEGW